MRESKKEIPLIEDFFFFKLNGVTEVASSEISRILLSQALYYLGKMNFVIKTAVRYPNTKRVPPANAFCKNNFDLSVILNQSFYFYSTPLYEHKQLKN